MDANQPQILTVGHSTHPIEAFLRLLRGAGVELVADVRRHPSSRRNPQFGAPALRDSLDAAGIGYESLGETLGGRRASKAGAGAAPGAGPDNSAWKDASFRAYADHMASDEFAAGMVRLAALARERRTAVMCAEADPSRCHRRLIADALLARGWRVLHLLPNGRLDPHELNPDAVVEGRRVSYPGQPTLGI